MQSNRYQNRFWKELTELKFHILYLEIYQISMEKWEGWISIILSVLSSSSIATWAVWQKHSFIWAILIGVSQVLQATRPHLSFQNRSKSIAGACIELKRLLLSLEDKWYYISEGLISNEDIHKELISKKEQEDKITSRYFGSKPLPSKQSFIRKAERKAETYFLTIYQVKEGLQ